MQKCRYLIGSGTEMQKWGSWIGSATGIEKCGSLIGSVNRGLPVCGEICEKSKKVNGVLIAKGE